MYTASHRISVFRRRNIIFLICAAACLYFIIAVMSSYVTVKELTYPTYTLISIKEGSKSEISDLPDVAVANLSNAKFLPSVFATSRSIDELAESQYYLARVLAHQIIARNVQSNQSVFSCVCGRVSDACVCCGIPKISASIVGLEWPLILFSPVDTDPATFCMNITYLPKKQGVKMTGYLTPASDFEYFQKMVANGHMLRLNLSRLLVLYDSQFVPVHSPPNICAENSKEDPDVVLCTQLSSLRYGVASSGDHETLFTGCVEVTVLVKKRWPVIRCPKVCFQAHRGAAGDVDQAEARAKEPKSTSTINPVLNENKNADKSILPNGHEIPKGRTADLRVSSGPEVKAHEPVLLNIANPVVP